MSQRTPCLIALAFGLPAAVLADLNQTVMLSANTALNLETGATSGSGGDILWNGTTITPQGDATALVIGDIPFNLASETTLRFLPGYSKASIAARDLTVNNVFAVHTNANRYARVLVQANSGGTIRLQFTTFGAPAGAGGIPTITAIQNNSSRVPRGFPNYGIAPSSLFVIVGSGLADPGDPVLQSSQAPGIPLTLNGASITVVVNGKTTRPGIWYTSPTQIAAVLPADTPIGDGTLTVTYKGVTTAAAPLHVVPSAVGINVYNGSIGVATDALTGALLTYTNSGTPGENVVLWTTGLGADPADSDTIFTTTPHAVSTALQIYIGGIAATILYQGASGYPGVNQINIVIPPDTPSGCSVPLVALTGSIVSNVAVLPVNAGGGACRDALTGFSGTQLSQGEVRTGLVSLVQTNRPRDGVVNAANAAFGKYTGLAAAATGLVPAPGGCVVAPAITGGPLTFSGLDAGTITLTGPNGLAATLMSQLGLKGAYNVLLASGAITPGTFTFKGSGGTDVGSFTATVELANPLMSWTNQSAAENIDRSQGLLVTWTGGNPGTFVVITGTSGANSIVGGFTCLAPVAAGRFTVPAYILLAMPSGPGAVDLQNYTYSTLSASGIDTGLALGDIAASVTSTFR